MAVSVALNNLKGALLTIDPSLEKNTGGFNGQVGDASLQVSLEDGSMRVDVEGNYPTKSLQAAFNIAEIAHSSLSMKGILGLLAGNGKVLKHSFDYLDEDWVPKIVDETTYKIGLALQAFLKQIVPAKDASEEELNDALNDLFSFLPALGKSQVIKKVKEKNSLQILFDMKELLDARLAFYEQVLKSDKLKAINEHLNFVQQQRDRLDKEVIKPCNEIDSDLENITKKLEDELTLNELDFTLQTLNQHLDTVDTLAEKGETWDKSNKDLPDTIPLHMLFTLTSDWMRHVHDKKPHPEFLQAAVQGQLEAGLASGLDAEQKDIVSQPIKKALDSEYAAYQQSLKNLIQSIRTLQARVTSAKQAVQRVNELYEESKVGSPKYKLADSKSDVQVQLEFNKQQLAQFEQILEKIHAAKKAFEVQVDSLDGDETFKQYRENQIKIINEKHFIPQIASIEESIEENEKAIEKNEKAIAKSSKQGRTKELATLAKEVNATHRARHQSSAVLSRAEHEQRMVAQTVSNKRALLNQQYSIKVKTINAEILQKQKAIPSQHSIMQEAEKKLSKRRQILTESLLELKGLIQKIEETPSLYDIVGQFDPEELKTWLEIDDTHWLMGDYEQYSQENSRYGLNLSYVATWLNSQLNPHLSDYKQEDKQAWLKFIGHKIESIKKELTVNNIDTLVETAQEGIEEGSTFDLQQKYLTAKKEHSRLIKEVDDKNIQLKKLSDSKKAKENELDEFEKQAIDNVNEKRVNDDSAIFTHELAILRLGLTKLEYLCLELKEHDIADQRNNIMHEERCYADLSNDEKLAELTRLKDELNEQQKLVSAYKEEQGHIRKEPSEMLKKHQDSLKYLSKKYPGQKEQLTDYQTLINDTLTPLLKTNWIEIDTQLECLDAQESLVHLDKLAKIKEGFQNLYDNRRSRSTDKIQDTLDDLAKHDDYLESLQGSSNPYIESNLDDIQSLKHKVQEYIHRKPVISHFKDALFMQKSKGFREAMPRKELFENYSSEHGLLSNYIAKRNETYWFKDLMSGFAAFFLGCFGYQTESQKRENYVKKLNGELEKFKNAPSNYDSLSSVIKQGKKDYKPRKDEEQSLKFVLNKLENDLEPLKPLQENHVVHV